MEEYEVFKKPTVIKVVFEIRFPQLMNIGQNIGDFQLEIMDDFPISDKFYEQPFQIPVGGPGAPPISPIGNVGIVWKFQNTTKKNTLIVKSNRLNIISTEYKSYNHPEHPKFRDLIQDVVSKFLKINPIKKFERIGLRYIDHCPLENKTNNYFRNFYKPNFDLEQFNIEEIMENFVLIRMRREPHNLLFKSGIMEDNKGNYMYFMDFDGYAINKKSESFLDVSDELHKLIHKVYYDNITDELKKYMRE